VKRTFCVDGTYASIGTPTYESYSDSSIVKGNNYWYRVFATNGIGTSIGSNVIQITYSNTPPSMNLASTISLNEGTTEVVDVAASDADDDSLTYTIASVSPGDDAGDFEISTAGVISFKTAPDYESPADYDADNVYEIEVSVTDGADTVTQTIGIVVTDVEGS
jgi:Cadherin domain.